MLRENWNRLRSALQRDRLPVLSPQQGYDRWAASYEENMNPVQVLEAEALTRLLPDLQGLRVLDVGCGKGRASRLALDRGAWATVGVDLSEAMLEAAAASLPEAPAQWIQAAVHDLPFEAATFDVVIGGLMIGHVHDLPGALAEIARVLKPGGTLLLSDFHPYAALRGWQRAFVDAASGRTFAIENHPHLFEAYLCCFNRLGLVLDALEEPCHEGFPVVFVLRAYKKG